MASTPKAPRVNLEVTEDLIADALPRHSGHCMWAESLKAAVPDATFISVDIQTIRFTDPKKGLRYTYLTPRVCQVSLVQFDQGIRPEPHRVQLRNGQVTNSGLSPRRKLTDAEIEQRKKAGKKGREAQLEALRSQKLKGGKDESGRVATRIGGKTPPIAAGKRRAFGLRGLQY